MEKQNVDKLVIFLFLLVIVFMIFVAYYMIKNKQAFTQNPFIYGAKKLGNVECSCTQYPDNPTQQPNYFYFNESAMVNRNEAYIPLL